MPPLAPLIAAEPWSGRARLLAGLAFDPPDSPLRGPHQRAQREISADRAVYRIAPTISDE